MGIENKGGYNPDETRIDPVDSESTKIELENNLSLEELVKKHAKFSEEYGAWTIKMGGKEIEDSIEAEKENLITKANDFIELYVVLNRIEDLNKLDPKCNAALIIGSKERYDMPKLRHLITEVRVGKRDISYITGRLGLRNKVEELIAAGNK